MDGDEIADTLLRIEDINAILGCSPSEINKDHQFAKARILLAHSHAARISLKEGEPSHINYWPSRLCCSLFSCYLFNHFYATFQSRCVLQGKLYINFLRGYC
jgi:hypothetical protein